MYKNITLFGLCDQVNDRIVLFNYKAGDRINQITASVLHGYNILLAFFYCNHLVTTVVENWCYMKINPN